MNKHFPFKVLPFRNRLCEYVSKCKYNIYMCVYKCVCTYVCVYFWRCYIEVTGSITELTNLQCTFLKMLKICLSTKIVFIIKQLGNVHFNEGKLLAYFFNFKKLRQLLMPIL